MNTVFLSNSNATDDIELLVHQLKRICVNAAPGELSARFTDGPAGVMQVMMIGMCRALGRLCVWSL